MHPLFPRLDERPTRAALHLGEVTLSYGELARAARAHAGRLAAEGVRKGDRVAGWATPDVATVCALVGNA
ncbi:MAG: AMP-binding protein, partial [Anaeromyxobacteraceae bacterium]